MEIFLNTARPTTIFAFDSNGDPVNGLLDGDWTDKRIKKAGGAFAAMTVVITFQEAGCYSLTLSAAHTDTQGDLFLYFSAPGIKQINLQYQVVANPSSANFPAGAIEYTYTLTDSATLLPIAGAQIWIATDAAFTNIIWSGNSDAFGIARDVNNQKPFLDPGTYFIRSAKPGYSFPDDSEIVS